jgi:hypothetical protein
MGAVLLVDCCDESGFSNMELVESTTGGLVKFRGKFQEAEAVNKNKRIYPYDVLNDNVKRLLESVRGRRLIGELDHPTDSIVHFANASHVVTKLWWEGNTLMGEGEILRTPNGEVLRALIQDGIPIGISSRGVGNGKVNENGILVIGDSYKLITFDAVADPSTFAAFQEKVVSRRENYTPKLSFAERLARRSNNYEVKNETYCIDTASDIEAFVACCGGIVNSQVEQIKARL